MKHFLFIIGTFFNLSLLCTTLDEIALKHGTDKSSICHSYTQTYEKYFDHLKDMPIKFLEIGFYKGYSAGMWEEYFTKAQLFFIDINQDAYNYMGNLQRTSLGMVNQEDPIALAIFAGSAGSNFDIIIDDGGHGMNQQITSFKVLFPHLKHGGIYVIEDLHTSYPFGPNNNKMFGCANPKQQPTIEFLKNLVDAVNKVSASTGYADFKKCPDSLFKELSIYEKEIESIHFHASLCFIIKR